MMRIKLLCPRAVWIHYKKEEDRLYLEDLEKVECNMQITLMEMVVMGVKLKWFGYAHARYQEWRLGFTKLRFEAYSNGKVRAKNIKVIEE